MLQFERILVLAGTTPALWLALMARHDDGAGAGTLVLLLISGSSAALLLLMALSIATESAYASTSALWFKRFAWLAALQAQIAFLAFNAHAVVRIHDHAVYAWSSALLLWSATVAAPALFIHSVIEVRQLRARMALTTSSAYVAPP